MYFLEQLLAEWYTYQGYFVRTNIKFGKRPSGGYEGEMDVVAFDPKTGTLFHIETSGDADSWRERRLKFQKKFKTAAEYYNSEFNFKFRNVRRIAVVGFSESKSSIDLGNGIELVLIPEIVKQITEEMKKTRPTEKAIPEGYPLLRAIQFAVWYGSNK